VARRSPRPSRPTWTPNQIVAHNLTKARQLRGWTQTQAADALEPYLGTKLSGASWSAIERSVDGGRIREITADELVAFGRAFELPIGFFLTPPSGWDEHGVNVPDAGPDGLDGIELFDVVIGTEESLAEWETYLKTWPAPGHVATIAPDGTVAKTRRVQEDVHQRLAGPAALRAGHLLRQQFGDLDAARTVLQRLATLLDELGDDGIGDP
jgi:hypothetical protein